MRHAAVVIAVLVVASAPAADDAKGIDAKGLTPAADVAKGAWLRRVTFDLTSLPPTPEELAAFLKDTSAKAHETVIDRLLGSPRFGEHFARHWLHGVRFSPLVESSGYYRNWVVRAFNADLPFDQFIQYQLAGDLLPKADDKTQADRLAATQFLALSYREMDAVEGMGLDHEKLTFKYGGREQRLTDVTGKVVPGLVG